MTRDHEVLSFGELLTEEHGFISTVRKSAGSSNGGNEYVGLAMSGGGVRSAIFQVGVLQALATAHYLPQIDYIRLHLRRLWRGLRLRLAREVAQIIG